MRKEIPPTDGLPIYFKDLISSKKDLAQTISEMLYISKPALTCSGTVSLIISLETLHELEPEKNQVIIPAWTCPLVALAIEKMGLTVILCDLAKDDFNFDFIQLQQKINHKTLAVIATHFAGLYCDITSLREAIQPHQVYIIEDAAQAMGARYQEQSVGLQADIGFFSLAFGKGLTSAEGGIVFSRHPEIHQKLHEKSQALPILKDWEIKRKIELLGYALLYKPSTLSLIYGHPLRKALKSGDEISAVGDDFDQSDIPVHKLGQWRSHVAANAAERLPEHWKHAQNQARHRISKLKQLPHLKIFEEQSQFNSNFPFILLLADDKKITHQILEQLWTQGLGVTKLFVRAIHQYPALSHLKASMPNAESFAERCFSISNSAWLDDDSFEKIYLILQDIVKNN